jgi:addiction module HigA family antidote
LEGFLKPLGASEVSAARQKRLPLNGPKEVIRGRHGITADTAIRLARLLNTSPEFWMNLQNAESICSATHMKDPLWVTADVCETGTKFT